MLLLFRTSTAPIIPLIDLNYAYLHDTVDGALGANYLGVNVEDEFGVYRQPNMFLPVGSFSYNESSGAESAENVKISREYQGVTYSQQDTGGSFDMVLAPIGFGYILRSLFHSSGVSNNTVHSISQGGEQVSLSLESSLSNNLVVSHTGVQISSFNLTSSFNEIASVSCDFIAQSTQVLESFISNPQYATVDPFTFQHASLSSGGVDVADVLSFNLTVDNSQDRLVTLRNATRLKGITGTRQSASLSLNIDNASRVFYQNLLSKQDFGLDIDFVAGSASFSISLPTVHLSTVGVDLAQIGGTQSYSGVAVSTVPAPAISIEISNQIREFV